MLRRIAGPLALLFASCLVMAQGEVPVKISFGSEGEREVWIQKEGSEGNVPNTTKVSGKAVEIDVTTDTDERNVYVHDVASGNVSVRPLIDVIRDGSWTVLATDETHTYRVAFNIQHDDLPVASAIVNLKFEGGDRQELLTPGDNGLVVFNVVPFGDVEVTVDYKSDGENRSLGAQVFESKPEMGSQAAYPLTIDDEVETVAPAVTSDSEASDSEASDSKASDSEASDQEDDTPKQSIAITIVQYLLGLLVVGGLSYGIWRIVKANPEGTEEFLKKAGVPMGGDPGSTSSNPVAHNKPGPPQQIILDGGTPPSAGSSTPVAPVAGAAPVVKNPRLVKTDGSVFMVMEGDNKVGREAGLPLSLEDESSLSRNHAQLTRTGDSVAIKDLGSTNGTFVNGAKITSDVTLNPGDSVQFGAVQYRYEE